MENYIILAPLLLIVCISHKVIDRQFSVKRQHCRYWSFPRPREDICDGKGESCPSNCVRKKWLKSSWRNA